jgi:hypothetical protein
MTTNKGMTTPPLALRISLELGTGPHRTVLTTSGGEDGEFADAAMGLRTGEVDVEAGESRARSGGGGGGGLWVVLERIGGAHSKSGSGGGGGGICGGGGVQVEVLSDGMVRVGGWEVAEED